MTEAEHGKGGNEGLKRQLAIALGYDGDNMQAPQVLAKGHGYVAQKIMALAEQNNLPVHRDEALAQALSQVDIGLDVPEKLYAVVAEVFAHIMQAEKTAGSK